MSKLAGHAYLVVRQGRSWYWRPRFSQSPAVHLGVHWLRLYVGFPR